VAVYGGALLGIALLVFLAVRADLPAMLHSLALGGARLLWLIPYRVIYFLLYALGWLGLLRPYDPQRRAGFAYVFWVTTVREAVDRLLPVASVGGSVIGVRLLRWRGLPATEAGATVIVEILLTLIVLYIFTATGLLLLSDLAGSGHIYRRMLLGFLFSLPVPAFMLLALRYGSVFRRIESLLRPMVRDGAFSAGAAALDRELRATLGRGWTLTFAAVLQLIAVASSAFEIGFAMRLFGHPIGLGAALVLESLTQAARHVAFIVPAGVGVQEAGLVLFGHLLGISGELALAISMAKRMREVLCGLPALISWQWMEGRRVGV
jgi:putative membrane protein